MPSPSKRGNGDEQRDASIACPDMPALQAAPRGFMAKEATFVFSLDFCAAGEGSGHLRGLVFKDSF
jgi:hypothetical protein